MDNENHGNSEQTRLPCDESAVDKTTEIEEVCGLIPDSDVRLCAQRIFILADETSDRKLSTVDVMRLVMILTGKNRRSALNSMLERMKTYRICVGCELGHSLIINKPKDVKQFLLETGLGRREKQQR